MKKNTPSAPPRMSVPIMEAETITVTRYGTGAPLLIASMSRLKAAGAVNDKCQAREAARRMSGAA